MVSALVRLTAPPLTSRTGNLGTHVFPFAAGLVDFSVDKGLMPAPGFGGVDSNRLQNLEEKFSILEKGVQELLSLQRGDGGFVSPAEIPASSTGVGATPKRKSALKKPQPEAPPGLSQMHNLPGLDPAAVAAGLQAGIPMEQMRDLSAVLGQKPGKLSDFPRSTDKKDGLLTDSDEEEAAEEFGAAEAGVDPTDPMAKAILKLTDIMGVLAKKKSTNLEDALDQVGGGSGLGDVSSSMGRKHAAARQALLKAYRDDPKLHLGFNREEHAGGLPSSELGSKCFHDAVFSKGLVRKQKSYLTICSHHSLGLVNSWRVGRSTCRKFRPGPSKMLLAPCCSGAGELGPRVIPALSRDIDGTGCTIEQLPNPRVAGPDGDGDHSPHRSSLDRGLCRSSEAVGQLRGDAEKAESTWEARSGPSSTSEAKRRRKRKRKGQERSCPSRCLSDPLQQTSPAVVGRSSSFDGLSESGGARQLDGCGGAGVVVFESADFAADGDPHARTDDFMHEDAEPGFSADADIDGGLGYSNNDVGPNVPGAKASTVRIHTLWHSLIRDIQAGATPFAIFFQTMLRKPLVPIKKAPTISTWPMPLPFSKYEDCDLVSNNEVGFRKLLNLQIGFLNYLSSRPSYCSSTLCLQGC